MDFRQEFKSSFIRLPALGAGMSEYSLLGEVYGSTPDHTVGDMISVLAHSRRFPTTSARSDVTCFSLRPAEAVRCVTETGRSS